MTAPDGHELGAYGAAPERASLGAVVILQEIFGVNGHLRSIVDGYAEDGYVAIAPALFDRVQRDVELTYEGGDLQKAFSLMQRLSPETALKDFPPPSRS